MMRFEFATATQILFGQGTLQETIPLIAERGNRVFVVTGSSLERVSSFLEELKKQNLQTFSFQVIGEPTTQIVLEATQKARESGCNVVVGIGGGSAVDVGKVVAALLTNQGDLFDYLEVIGKAQPLKQVSAPYFAVPTTAGTGAEVTRNAVLDSPEHRVKVSMRSPLMLPYMAVIDPLLTVSMPPSVTASTGLDALTQLIEPYVSNKANPLTDGICLEGLKRATRSLKKAYEEGGNVAAREDMAVSSLFGGLSLANAKLGAVHGFAGPIGGMFPAPHGEVCARLLPLVMETNVKALQSREPNSPVLARFEEVSRILTGKPIATVGEGVKWVQEIAAELKVPSLSQFGMKKEDFPGVVEKSQRASSMKGNPIVLTAEELTSILEQAF